MTIFGKCCNFSVVVAAVATVVMMVMEVAHKQVRVVVFKSDRI